MPESQTASEKFLRVQGQLSHVLSAHPDQFGDVSKANGVGIDLDESRGWNGFLHGHHCTDDGSLRRASFAGEVQRDPTWLANANQGVVAARGAKTLNEYVGIAFRGREPVLQCELVFHRSL